VRIFYEPGYLAGMRLRCVALFYFLFFNQQYTSL